MKKIVIIDGGPRKNFNTASMLQKFADGANSVSDDENWEKDLQKAYDAGKRMAENISMTEQFEDIIRQDLHQFL